MTEMPFLDALAERALRAFNTDRPLYVSPWEYNEIRRHFDATPDRSWDTALIHAADRTGLALPETAQLNIIVKRGR